MGTLSTIGYEGASLEDFIATLQQAGISTLVDIRELPISRRRGFAKTALSTALSEAGIEYVHLKGLGDPKEGREAARAKDMKGFVRIFSQHMKSTDAQKDLSRAVVLASTGAACLMCYERDPNVCHRKLVSSEISAISEMHIQHLGVRDGAGRKVQEVKGARSSAGKSTAARRAEAR